MIKNLCLSISLLCISLASNAQRPTKLAIGQSGCHAYFLCNVSEFGSSFSEDSSVIYTGDCIGQDSINYGIICVKLKEQTNDLQQAEDVMIQYMDYLKKAYDISTAVGYGKGHTMASNPSARGVIDFWTDRYKREWKIKGWTDGKFIAVLYVVSLKGTLAYSTKNELFLDGFRFPGKN